MKQVIQDLRHGIVKIEEVPAPVLRPGGLLVRTVASVVSVGTERQGMEFGGKSLLRKAWERPDLTRQVWEKFKREGLSSTVQAVRGRLTTPVSLGYSSSGIIEGVGSGVEGFQVGDTVACAGVGYASHAGVVWVPKNLCVKFPSHLSFEEAAFSTIGAVSIQGIRLCKPTLGESVVVIGLGVIGQIAFQCLKANGCRVFGIDPEADRVALALELGIDDAMVSGEGSALDRIRAFTRGRGADAVLITAATESSEPVELAGELCRRKGRVVVIGAVGMTLPRRPYYERELTLKVSMSYGPGRYDPTYEEKGIDYPIGYVRWTEGRNMEAFLDLLAQGKVNVQRLITHRFPIEDAEKAYDLLSGRSREKYLGLLLAYPDKQDERPILSMVPFPASAPASQVRLGLIGAGSFARSTLLPILKRRSNVSFWGVATSGGLSSKSVAERYGFRYCTTDYREILRDEGVNAVIIATRHRLHGPLVVEAIKAGKHVFVEKPLCVHKEELAQISESLAEFPSHRQPILMVGFNRRFAVCAKKARDLFGERNAPLLVSYRVNAGPVPVDHWLNDPEEGGRITGEVCHFVDFISWVVGKRPVTIFAQGTSHDSTAIILKYEDGSVGNIQYVTRGHRSLPKERIEIFGDDKGLIIDDFRRAEWFSGQGKGAIRGGFKQDKGHRAEMEAFIDAVLRGGTSSVDINDAIWTTRVTFKILESLAVGMPVECL